MMNPFKIIKRLFTKKSSYADRYKNLMELRRSNYANINTPKPGDKLVKVVFEKDFASNGELIKQIRTRALIQGRWVEYITYDKQEAGSPGKRSVAGIAQGPHTKWKQ